MGVYCPSMLVCRHWKDLYQRIIFILLTECYATLSVFMDFFCKKNRQKKIHQKKIQKKKFQQKKNFSKKQFHQKKVIKFSVNILFQIFFGYHGSIANLVYACKILGCLGPLVLEDIENGQKVVNPKLIYYTLYVLYI
jgi:hypothetical protein